MVKVRELMELLAECDADANVFMLGDSRSPWENALVGVAVREDVSREREDEAEEPYPAPERGVRANANDVFLVEGGNVRCGSRAAWRIVRRP
jgi:hypothetical protein